MDEEQRASAAGGPFREYANNTFFNPSRWDLTIVFGQLSARIPNQSISEVEWHTAITMPWTQAKIAAYFFLVNLMLQEAEVPITMPPALVPPRPEYDGDDQRRRALYANLQSLHDEFFGKGASDENGR